MKNTVANSPSEKTRRSGNSAPNARATKGAVTIQCGYCQNTFSAVPRDAVCLKCKRPANTPLSWPNRLLDLILFPLGLLQAILLRASRPYAAGQALLFSMLGAAAWGAVYLLFLRG